MFGWLRKRQEKELLKLLDQNFRASDYLLTNLTDVDLKPKSLAFLKQANEQARSLLMLGKRVKNMPSSAVHDWLNVNKDLRRIYDQSHADLLSSGYGKNFDDQFTPLLGWDRYFDEHYE